MKIHAPYGDIEIDSKEQAAYFITHMCNDCYQNNLMNCCSGELSHKCNEIKNSVKDAFF